MKKPSGSTCDHSHEGDHDHAHGHSHTQGQNQFENPNRLFKIGIALNLVFVFVELGFGYGVQSLALISDAMHNLTDVFGLLIGWLGYSLSVRKESKIYSNLTALINSLLLITGSVWVIVEAIERFKNPTLPTAWVVILVALIGCLINFYTAKLFHNHQHDLNMKSAYLHLLGDALISVGVVISGILIYYFATPWIDPAVSLVISVIIMFVTWPVLSQSFKALRKNQ